MCLVATGGADAYYEMGIHCWDMAGAGIIVTEAGGVLMDVTGEVMAPQSVFPSHLLGFSSLCGLWGKQKQKHTIDNVS